MSTVDVEFEALSGLIHCRRIAMLRGETDLAARAEKAIEALCAVAPSPGLVPKRHPTMIGVAPMRQGNVKLNAVVVCDECHANGTPDPDVGARCPQCQKVLAVVYRPEEVAPVRAEETIVGRPRHHTMLGLGKNWP